MIRRIGSDLETFKKLEFSPGLNVLLADKSEGASDRQSRNGAGKTSFVEIVHFLTGGNVGKDSIFRSNALKASALTIQMDVGGDGFTVARSGSTPGKVQVNGPVEGWPIASTFNQDAGVFEISNTNWGHVLGRKWFGLDAPPDPDAKFQPTFRSLFSYFVRRQASGGFNKPTQHATMQQTWDQQVAISYLLGLDWRISQGFQGFREKEKIARSLGKAARSGELGPNFGRAADLRTKLAVAAKRTETIRDQLDSFAIIPQYTELEAEASAITGQMNASAKRTSSIDDSSTILNSLSPKNRRRTVQTWPSSMRKQALSCPICSNADWMRLKSFIGRSSRIGNPISVRN